MAEVEVNTETGQVRVLRITHAWDCGYPINPMAVEGQIEGQVGHGLGQALFEGRILEGGQQLNPSLLGYPLPTAPDMPAVDPLLVETNDPRGPFGAKECSEGPQKTIVPAILNAIHHATGVWVREVPVSPEQLLQRLKEGG